MIETFLNKLKEYKLWRKKSVISSEIVVTVGTRFTYGATLELDIEFKLMICKNY